MSCAFCRMRAMLPSRRSCASWSREAIPSMVVVTPRLAPSAATACTTARFAATPGSAISGAIWMASNGKLVSRVSEA